MNFFKLSAVLFSFLLICGCNKSVEQKIARTLKDCEKSECEVDIKDFTEFEWDTAYFFEVPVSESFINNVIGVKYGNYKEFTRPVIFMKDHKVVYSENNLSSIESLTNEQVVFNGITDTAKYKVISIDRSNFYGTLNEYGKIRYFILKEKSGLF